MDDKIAELKPYICSSNDALELKLVRHVRDLEDETTTFKPEMSHQVFENETIFGYKDLKIQLYYAAGNLETYLGMTYSEKVDKTLTDGVEPDEVLKNVAEKLDSKFHTNIDSFAQSLDKDLVFKPEGELLSSVSIDDDGETRRFEIYKSSIKSAKFKEHHLRLRTFLLWYIDAASFIDVDDDQWDYFNMYERIKMDADNSVRYATVGFATVYLYYAFPEHIRPRIAQVLILPPFQGMGLGNHLLRGVYQEYMKNELVKDITVEDPSEDFQRLRDYVDCTNCCTLSSFSKDKLMQGFNEAMATEARKHFKINKKQARRVYEILRLKATNLHNSDEYRSYRLDIKNRLNIPYKKEENDQKKLELAKKSKEGSSGLSCISQNENRIQVLEKEYRDLEDEYCKVIKRLDVLC
ncbi:histone acetyltransferase type B catalytic subunit [Copidosoma floridanum]|uniref:histone acetyltransferase type B catalytic subunit n=1 Tax=Copidosoma floridanum TaxID=29053 RepID=UPI0006C9E53C|nr:histone acetyltransferase type B catalytic subunit [Copidosoma floridanum]